MLTTRSTILFPIRTGFTLSPLFRCDLPMVGLQFALEVMPFGLLPLDGEQDCLLGRAGGPGSTEDDLEELGAPGLPREAEEGLSGKDVLRFGGASRENPGISDGFQGLDLTVGELPRDDDDFGTEVPFEVVVVGRDFAMEEDRLGGAELAAVG